MPIFDKIILSLGIVIGLFLFKKLNSITPKIIFIVLVISFLTIFIEPGLIKEIGYWMFGLSALSFAVYNITQKKIFLTIIGLHSFGMFLWGILEFLYYDDLKVLMMAPVVAYIIILIRWKKNVNQLSIISIFTSFQIVQLSRFFI